MVYEKPAVEVVGAASELIQHSLGTGVDGGPTGHNRNHGETKLEE